MSLSYIGPFTFISLDGQPDIPKPSVAMVARAGVDGLGFFNTGTRGEPFVLRSFTDASDFPTARYIASQYTTVIGSIQPCVWSGLPMAADGVYVMVLGVRPVEVRAVAGGYGVTVSNPGAICVCDWALVAVSASQVN